MSDAPAFRVLVCGGRDYDDRGAVWRALELLHTKRGIGLVIHGGATGADTFAGEWAKLKEVPVKDFPVSPGDWVLYGKKAGPLRNERMLLEGKPDGVIAFPRANGKIGNGTADMVRRATEAGVPVWRPEG